MSRPVPLMFVSSPPVYEKVSVVGEESTSIFSEEVELVAEEETPSSFQEVDASILKKVEKLRSSIGQRVYQGLTFVLATEEIKGNVGKVIDQTITIETDGNKEKEVTVDLNQIKDILWRGQTLPEN